VPIRVGKIIRLAEIGVRGLGNGFMILQVYRKMFVPVND